MLGPVNDATFHTAVLASDIPVLVEFGASWCPPCRMIAPVLEAIAVERAGRLRVVTVDVDANPLLQVQYGVMSLPTLLLFVGHKPVSQVVGFTSKRQGSISWTRRSPPPRRGAAPACARLADPTATTGSRPLRLRPSPAARGRPPCGPGSAPTRRRSRRPWRRASPPRHSPLGACSR